MTPLTQFGSRLTPLCDGRSGLRGGLSVQVKRPSAGDPLAASAPDQAASGSCLDFIASCETLDRYHEIISVEGWRLENYRRNPVFQNAHQYGDILFTLGKALVTEVRSVGGRSVLFQRIEFAVDINPMSRIAFGLYANGYLNAVSVGFLPIRWLNADGTEHSLRSAPAASANAATASPPPSPREAPINLSTLNPQPSTIYSRKYLEQELLEVSAVGIPANPDALQLAFKSGALQKADLRDLAELFTQLAYGKTAPDSNVPLSSSPAFLAASAPSACASGAARDEAHWLRLARQVRRLLRNP
jgi:hypothetical protein